MISLTCTSCKKVLEIDDAFAGGVCRCQYCGTIQTVPASLKQSSRAGSPAIGTGAKTLYQRPSRGNINAPGDAATAASGSQSGARGTSSGAGEMPPTRAPVPGAGRKSLIPPIAMRSALAAVVVVVVILAVLVWFILR
jgi:hypothetical protein